MIYKKGYVSIITPAYNCVSTINKTIESIQNQTYKNWEVIIVDDVSTDGSVDVITQMVKNDLRFKIVIMKEHSGAAACRNMGIKLACGEYIAFLDSDDLWNINKLNRQLNFMKANNCDFSFTEYEHIDEYDHLLGIKARAIKNLTYDKMLLHCYTGCLTVMYKQKKEKIYGPVINNNDDYALFLEVLKKSENAMGMSENLAKYRIRKKSLSRNKLRKIPSFIILMTKYQNKNIVQAIFYLVSNQLIKMLFKYTKISKAI